MRDPKPCAIQGCKKHSVTRGWCSKHYVRWLKHGNPEVVNVTSWRAMRTVIPS